MKCKIKILTAKIIPALPLWQRCEARRRQAFPPEAVLRTCPGYPTALARNPEAVKELQQRFRFR
ncbi:MAG: hypothetical protein E6927_15860, partial [Klebsiella michiganensis]|nr:hypothetical protein [Klebsiella michiganensis]MDU7323349.1 hypothetical protein [Klebsiella michiganensis]